MRPAGLTTSSEMVVQWKIEGESLAEGQDDAVRLALADQEGAGLDIVTDGETPVKRRTRSIPQCACRLRRYQGGDTKSARGTIASVAENDPRGTIKRRDHDREKQPVLLSQAAGSSG
jgi:hypothetical protein